MNEKLTDFTPAVLKEAIEENAIEGCKDWQRWPKIEIVDEPNMLSMMSRIPYPIFNGVFRAAIAPEEVEPVIDQVIEQVRSRNIPMIWWIGPSTRPSDLGTHLRAKGFNPLGGASGMAMDLNDLDGSKATHPGLVIEEVRDMEKLRIACEIVSSVNDFTDLATAKWFEMHAALGFGPDQPWRYYLGWMNEIPVTTASLFLGRRVASIVSVATRPEFRRKGIGSSVSLEPLREARRMGYRVGTLCASEMGEGAYRKMGFRAYCPLWMYLWVHE